MNERIKELAEQAGITTNLDTDYFEKDINKWVDYYSEKFAELIVRECMNICKQHPSRTVSNNWNADAVAPHLVQQFEEHFGVEE